VLALDSSPRVCNDVPSIDAESSETIPASDSFDYGDEPCTLVECRIFQEEDDDRNMESPCACSRSLKQPKPSMASAPLVTPLPRKESWLPSLPKHPTRPIMMAQSPKPSCHDVITGRWSPSGSDSAAGRVTGYEMTTNIINRGLECGKGFNAKVEDRIGFYKRYCDILGVSYGSNLDCYNQRPFRLALSLSTTQEEDQIIKTIV
ncbi:hypothetical protein KI387_006863, partial [Taxus chinensis]